MATISKQAGHYLEASAYLDQYFQLEPGDEESKKEKAIVRYLTALKERTEDHFKDADEGLAHLLEGDWGWEKGHMCRLDLYFQYGKIAELKQIYERTALEVEGKRIMGEKILRAIHLTNEFQNTIPQVQTSLSDVETGWRSILKKYWPIMFGIPVLMWTLYETAVLSHSAGESKRILFTFVMFILGLAVLMLFLFNMGRIGKKPNANKDRINEDPKKD